MGGHDYDEKEVRTETEHVRCCICGARATDLLRLMDNAVTDLAIEIKSLEVLVDLVTLGHMDDEGGELSIDAFVTFAEGVMCGMRRTRGDVAAAWRALARHKGEDARQAPSI